MTDMRIDTAPTSTQSVASQPSGQLFPCTVSDCKKTFKTQKSRAQHLEMSSHGGKPEVLMTQTVSGITAQSGQRPETVTSDERRQIGSIERYSATKTGSGLQHMPKSEPSRQNANNVKHPKKPTNAAKSARLPLPNIAKDSARVPLFGWDTRWSKISSTKYESVVNALKALIPTPESWCLSVVDKTFWTPDHRTASPYDSTNPGLRAIVLDCEMVGIGPNGKVSELARLSAVDFLTGELLIDTLVEPACPVTDMRTKWSGITAEAMQAAVASGNVLKGSTAARTELFRYMDSRTILVGHSLQYDLEALGIRHSETVDSAILAEAAVGKGVKQRWGLKTMCKELLKITIQDHGKHGHDSIEDALAAREVVLWCLSHKTELKTWGKRKKQEYYSKPKGSNAKGQRKNPAVQLQNVLGYKPDYHELDSLSLQSFFSDESDDYEFRVLSVKELNELCHYPEWYDNWD